ncbi:hypothetical protein PPERSA_09597 [Pseudocohnilembus persalinus]|uniref:Uncharacterized protein n=1 Tax=Pseudocohnilembus persalinus TaxID=266149 RepID=A0A0V0QFK7_PSEPJ|nr:hypothetical protein PPERSA_09597 [Pseudocohnilembus persalinus]|eukprot:KRX00991.1 hypothetical protein PPERSA_09597 [Pseudocohnilembus persalinus]
MKTEKNLFQTIFQIPHILNLLFFILVLNSQEKQLTFILACTYSCIEFLFTYGHTTIEQWFVNLNGIPIFILWPLQYIQNLEVGGKLYVQSENFVWIFVILMFPILIWILEIFEGIWLEIWNNGQNPAWFYISYDARFGGKIKLGYFFHWLLMGTGYFGLFYLVQ